MLQPFLKLQEIGLVKSEICAELNDFMLEGLRNAMRKIYSVTSY